jgi:hypothetical protein
VEGVEVIVVPKYGEGRTASYCVHGWTGDRKDLNEFAKDMARVGIDATAWVNGLGVGLYLTADTYQACREALERHGMTLMPEELAYRPAKRFWWFVPRDRPPGPLAAALGLTIDDILEMSK